MGKHIWLVNHYALPPYLPGGTRHYDLSCKLVERGYKVTIFASSFHYQKLEQFKKYNKNQYFLEETINGVHFIWFNTLSYTKNNWKRFVNMLSFTRQFNRYVRKEKFNKPDIIVGSSIHLFAVFGAYKAALKFDSRFYMEVRDLWPQTLIDLGMSKWHPAVLLFGFLEKYLYNKAEKIITLLPKSHTYIENLGINKNKIYWLPNGVDLSRFDKIHETDKATNGTFNVVYTGVIGMANRLDLAVETAEVLKKRSIEDVFLKIIGEGQERKRLMKIVEQKKLDNINFVGAIPKEQVPVELANADVLFFTLADSPVYKYGLSANKLFDYLAAKKPIIFSCEAGNDPVKESGAGISIPPDNPDKVVDAILELKALPKEMRKQMGENGYHYVKETHEIHQLSNKLEAILFDKVKSD